MGFFSFLFGKSDSKKNIVEIDGKVIHTNESENSISKNYGLQELNDKQKMKFSDLLKNAEVFIRKYSDKEDFLNAQNLDYVIEQWKMDKSICNQDDVVQMIGCAFGQDLINCLNCEWQILTDEYGTDFTAIHKTFNLFGFPFSSVQKAIEEDNGSFYGEEKLTLLNTNG